MNVIIESTKKHTKSSEYKLVVFMDSEYEFIIFVS